MSKFILKSPIEHLPILTEYQLSVAELSSRLQPLGLEKAYLWDYNYWYVSLEDWGKVMEKVLINMPKYTVDKFDCENFAMLVSARIAEVFKLNTCGVAIGQSPFGEHGYNLLVHKDGLVYYEPQNGNYIEVEDGSYRARLVLFGG